MDSKRHAFELFLISFLALFFEILFIRWLASEVRVLAYFKNMALIACFLGLGLGVFISDKKRDLFGWFIPLLALTVFLVYIDQDKLRVDLIPTGESISFWGYWSATGNVLRKSVKFFVMIIGSLFITVLIFIPLGQRIGVYLKRYPPLAAYSINIFGSIVGIAAFTLLSILRLTPVWWFAIGLLISLYFYRKTAKGFALALFFTVAIPVFIFFRAEDAYWSPYQKITVKPRLVTSIAGKKEQVGYEALVNQDFLLSGTDLRDESLKKFPALKKSREYYGRTYRITKPEEVLIVGSGMGNDVAAALRNGAKHVDAVEIDPQIVDLGYSLHPEKPYDSPKVTVYVDDARSFFTRKNKKYDLIVFGFLDSHAVFSSRSSLRLDNFVYTIESFRQAKSLLKEDGSVCVQFAYRYHWMRDRFYRMLEKAFGHAPQIVTDVSFIVWKKPGNHVQYQRTTETFDKNVVYATDDWPHIYTLKKKVPNIYLYILSMIFALSIGFILVLVPGSTRKINLHFFFLGAAFMLIEVRSICQLALLLGSTWIVNSLVITAVLVMILIANLVVHLRPKIPILIPYILLWFTLLLLYFFPIELFLSINYGARAVFATLLLTLPLFFAGIIFATSFKRTNDVTAAFASNLIGAILGGLFEYSSFIFGIRSLCLFSLLLYVLSFLPILLKKGHYFPSAIGSNN